MDASIEVTPERLADPIAAHSFPVLMPIVAALAYPSMLQGFTVSIGAPGNVSIGLGLLFAGICLLGALATPVLGLIWAMKLSAPKCLTAADIHARRLAYLAIAAPPLFVFTGVTRGLLGGPLSDEIVWIGFWLLATSSLLMKRPGAGTEAPTSVAKWRVAHGVSAALIILFILFHLGNHLLGWLGPQVHSAVMGLGRTVYRSSPVEPVLVALLLFQIGSGLRLFWRWTAQPADWPRVFQIGSGVYLAAFLVAHLNSALISARWARGTATDWAWASGAPDGLIYDPWNIRLLPHYAFGVFFILSHAASGLRQVAIAHGLGTATASRLWMSGVVASAFCSAAIIAGLIGARL